MRHRGAHGIAVVEDNAHGLFGKYRGPPARHVRRAGDAELPRDEERHLRRGRRAADQRRRATSSAPRSSARRARTAAGSSAARSTSTPGSTSARATCPRTCWPRSCTRSSSSASAIQAQRRRVWERYHASLRRLGGASTASACRTCPRTASSRITCTTCCCRRWRARQALIAHLKERGHPGRVPLPAAARLGHGAAASAGAPGDCPVTEDVGRPAAAAAVLQRPDAGGPGNGGACNPRLPVRSSPGAARPRSQIRCNHCACLVGIGAAGQADAVVCPGCGWRTRAGWRVRLERRGTGRRLPGGAARSDRGGRTKAFLVRRPQPAHLGDAARMLGRLAGPARCSTWAVAPAYVLAALERAGLQTCGLDMNWAALHVARRRTRGVLVRGLAQADTLAPQFDVVTLCDVIEHTSDDVTLLRNASQSLRLGGMLLVTVPAQPHLWTVVDAASGHKRRYGRPAGGSDAACRSTGAASAPLQRAAVPGAVGAALAAARRAAHLDSRRGGRSCGGP